MQRDMLRPKNHHAGARHCELHYEGVCAIAENLLEAAKHSRERAHRHLEHLKRRTPFDVRDQRKCVRFIPRNGCCSMTNVLVTASPQFPHHRKVLKPDDLLRPLSEKRREHVRGAREIS